jgi:hypothetical protein
VSLWATVAVESRRCVDLASRTFAASSAAVTAWLQDAAAIAEEPGMASVSRLCQYGRALLQASPAARERSVGGVLLRPPLRMLTAWSLAAEEDGVELEAWTTGMLEAPVGEPVRWEASAALAGQTLAEWALVQAARRLRSASTLAQTAG